MLKNILHNWRTSLLGTGALAGAITNFVNNPEDLKGSIIMAVIGILGLIVADGHKPHADPGNTALKG